MASFIFSKEDCEIIEFCVVRGHKYWDDDSLSDLKRRLKEYLKDRQRNVCCYCLRSFHGEFNLVIDIEHILPKHKYADYMFKIDNLAASCKRCNMKMKGRRIDFIKNPFVNSVNPFAGENYFFIHPNSDVFEEHIRYIHVQNGRDIMVFYQIINNSPKGVFSHNFFGLDKLAVYTYNKAQGLSFEDEDSYSGDPNADDIEDDEQDEFHDLDIEAAIDELFNKYK